MVTMSFIMKLRSFQSSSMASVDFSGDFGPSQWNGSLVGSTAGVVSRVACNVFSHGVI